MPERLDKIVYYGDNGDGGIVEFVGWILRVDDIDTVRVLAWDERGQQFVGDAERVTEPTLYGWAPLI